MKLEFKHNKPNTQTVQFRIDPTTKKMLTMLKNHYKVGTGELLKEMIRVSHESIRKELYGASNWRDS